MFKWYKKFMERTFGEICDICGKRAQRQKSGALVHWNGDFIYVHPEHVIKSKKFRDMLNSDWYKKVSKEIKEKGVYVMSHQEEASMSHGGIEGVSSPAEKNNDGSDLLAGMCIGAMLSD